MRTICIYLFAFGLFSLAACKNKNSTGTTTTTSDSAVGGTPAPSSDATDMSKNNVDSLQHTNTTGQDSTE